MKKFLLTLLLGVFMVGTLTAEESSNSEREAPDIVMQMDAPDVQPVISVEVEASTDVGWEATTNITYNVFETSEIVDALCLYRYANSIAYMPANITAHTIRPPDIYNRLL